MGEDLYDSENCPTDIAIELEEELDEMKRKSHWE